MKLQLKWFDLNRIVLAFIEQQHFWHTIIGATTLETLKRILILLM
jgi:hypothetical protein